MGAGASDGTTTLGTTATAVGTDSVSASVMASVTEVQAGESDAGETTTAAGAAQTGSGTTTDGSTLQSFTDLVCKDDRPNEHMNITKSPDDKWEMTGPACTARSSESTEPRYVAYWSQCVYRDTCTATDVLTFRWSDPDMQPSEDQLAGVTHLVLCEFHPGPSLSALLTRSFCRV